MDLRTLSLCDGYAGFELGLKQVGVPIRTVARVERDSYAAAVLVERMEQTRLDRAPVWDDLTTFDGAAWRGCVDLITAGFPCQPFSAAGERRGVDDDRWLWPAIGRIVRDVGPRLVFLENVPGLVRAGLPHVLADLARYGFDAEWGLYGASDVGAPHRRQRIWILAARMGVTDCGGLQADRQLGGGARCGMGRHVDGSSEDVADAESARRDQRRRPPVITPTIGRHGTTSGFPPSPDDLDGWERWVAEGGPEPVLRRGTHGRPLGLADALHLGGNGLVPLAAGTAFLQLAERLGVNFQRNENAA